MASLSLCAGQNSTAENHVKTLRKYCFLAVVARKYFALQVYRAATAKERYILVFHPMLWPRHL